MAKKKSMDTYTTEELKVAKQLFSDFYNIPSRFGTEDITVRLHTSERSKDYWAWEFEEKEVIEDALWIYIKYLEDQIKQGKGSDQGRPYKDAIKECDEKELLAKKYI